MSWDDEFGGGYDSDTHRADFTDIADAFSYAAMIDQRTPIESGSCSDSWCVRRVMHDNSVIDRDTWSSAIARDLTPDYADEKPVYAQ